MSNRNTIIGILVIGILFLGSNALYIVNEMERAVLLQLGRVVNPDVSTGLHFKIPFVQEVRKFDGRGLTVDAPPERFLTLEKKALIGNLGRSTPSRGAFEAADQQWSA